MQNYDSGYHVLTVPPCAPELFDELIRTSFIAVANLIHHSTIRNCTSSRLTKQFLMTAPSGSYLVSNIYVVSHKPIFSEVVADSLEDRCLQWERIKAVEANDRLAHLYPSFDAYARLSKIAEFERLLRQ